MAEPAVQARGLAKVYEPLPRWMRLLSRTPTREPVTALAGVDLELAPGAIAAIVGPNGAGKSTLFRILTGLTTASGGEARVCGIPAGGHAPALRRLVGFMPADERALHLRLSCRENLAFHGRLHGLAGSELGTRIDETLKAVGLAGRADRVGFALSSGMRARLLLARALLHRPRVLILDEPTGETDPVASHELLAVIREAAAERGAAVLISSHRLEEIEALGERVLLLHEGRVAYDGDLPTLRRTWDRPRIRIDFDDAGVAERAERRLRAANVEIESAASGSLSVRTELPAGTVLGHLDGELARVRAVHETHVELRDVLASMARGDA